MPSATCWRRHDGRASSARSTSGTLTLTTISRLEVAPCAEVEVLVRRAREAVVADDSVRDEVPGAGGDVVERSRLPEGSIAVTAQAVGGLDGAAFDRPLARDRRVAAWKNRSARPPPRRSVAHATRRPSRSTVNPNANGRARTSPRSSPPRPLRGDARASSHTPPGVEHAGEEALAPHAASVEPARRQSPQVAPASAGRALRRDRLGRDRSSARRSRATANSTANHVVRATASERSASPSSDAPRSSRRPAPRRMQARRRGTPPMRTLPVHA